MRTDIETHISTGDVVFTSSSTFKERDFKWVENPNGFSRYMYGEIDVPDTVTEMSIRNNGLYFSIPYTPKYKEFMVRIRRVNLDGSFSYIQNLDDGGEWFIVKSGLYGKEKENVFVSQLIKISDDKFYGRIESGCVELYSSKQSDFSIKNADRQNSNFLLACNPSNNYRYPITGVGLVNFINSSSISSGDLASTLQREFEDDGVVVNNAEYDYDSQSFSTLDLDTSNAE